MVLAITKTKEIHRFDAAPPPTFTASGQASIPLWFVRDFHHKQIAQLVWSPPNRTARPLVSLRDAYFWNWTLSSHMSRDSGVNSFTKAGSDSFSGATGSAQAAAKFHLEGKPQNEASTIAFSLQSGTAGYNFTNGDIEHALVFGQNGVGQIYERGVGKKHSSFSWTAGDKGLIEVYDGIVRYYKISATGDVTLLRSTRSLLSGAIAPTLTIYHQGGQIENVLVWQGEEATASIDLYGVIDGELQDLQNQASFDSLAEKTLNKDKREDFTYFTKEKNLMTLGLNLGWREEEEYQAFKEFFQYHDLSRPFIFVDNARHKLLPKAHPGLASNEMFAYFASAFKDNPLGAATFGVSVDIRQMIDPPNLF